MTALLRSALWQKLEFAKAFRKLWDSCRRGTLPGGPEQAYVAGFA